jgi:hypothetical protein
MRLCLRRREFIAALAGAATWPIVHTTTIMGRLTLDILLSFAQFAADRD